MARSKPTLRDVAKLAGCSTAVVSTVINKARGNTLASAEMQKRVRDAARKLGYRPNFASRSLIRRSAETIGIYVPPDPWAGIGLRYESAIVQGIEQACRSQGYDVLAINLSGAGSPEACFHKFAEQRIDGLILLHVDHEADWVESLLRISPNVAAVNYYGPAPIDCVNFDDAAAGRMATEYLASLGHRRIGFIGAAIKPLGPGATLRCEGYRLAMKQLGLPVDAQWIWNADNPLLRQDHGAETDDSRAAATHLWKQGANRPTAFVAYSDQMAVHAMRQLERLGAGLPKDMSVVGIDGSDICELVSPELSSVLQPFAAMGRRATELVIARATGHASISRKPTRELVAPQLVVRRSTVNLSEK